jgi:hypothetical protein
VICIDKFDKFIINSFDMIRRVLASSWSVAGSSVLVSIWRKMSAELFFFWFEGTLDRGRSELFSADVFVQILAGGRSRARFNTSYDTLP